MDQLLDGTREACNKVDGAWKYIKDWKYVDSYSPFVLTNNPMLLFIANKCEEMGIIHTRSSFGACIQQMKKEAISK